MKKLIYSSILFLAISAQGQAQSEIDSFGGNEALYLKAKALNPEVEKEVIQDRFINRSGRLELAPEFSNTFGGDAYNRTSNVGINAHYHITPKWSVGFKYGYAFNKLTPEGEAMVNRAKEQVAVNPGDPNYLYPQVIYPKSEMLGMVNWYPIVGKLSFGSWGVAHFDTYLTAGYGQTELSNSTAPTTMGGLGIGFWLSQNLTTRFEYRIQQYKAEYYNKTEDLMNNVASVQMGWLL